VHETNNNTYQIDTQIVNDNINEDNNDVIINPNTPMKANTDNEQISHNQENEEVLNTVIKDNNDNNLSDIKIERINTNSD